MELNFENLTIGQLKRLTEEYLKSNPDFKTALQLFEEWKQKATEQQS